MNVIKQFIFFSIFLLLNIHLNLFSQECKGDSYFKSDTLYKECGAHDIILSGKELCIKNYFKPVRLKIFVAYFFRRCFLRTWFLRCSVFVDVNHLNSGGFNGSNYIKPCGADTVGLECFRGSYLQHEL